MVGNTLFAPSCLRPLFCAPVLSASCLELFGPLFDPLPVWVPVLSASCLGPECVGRAVRLRPVQLNSSNGRLYWLKWCNFSTLLLCRGANNIERHFRLK